MRDLACEYSRLSLLLAARDVSLGGTSAPQRQKFHTDDVNQRLRNKSGIHVVPNVNLFGFMVDYGKVLCSTANELHQNSDAFFKEEYIPGKFCSRFITFTTPFTFDLFGLLSFVFLS